MGATVPHILIDLRRGRDPGARQTRDIDAVVEVASWDEFSSIREELSQSGFRPGEAPHEVRYGDVQLDLIPFGPDIVDDDRLTWPETGNQMSTLGLEEAFQSARQESIARNSSVPTATIPALVLLKVVAFRDRPEERLRDLVDLAYCCEHYEEGGERRFELSGLSADGELVQFEDAGAFLLGLDVAELAKEKALLAVRAFVHTISDEYAGAINKILNEERRLDDAEERRKRLYRLFRVFRAGLEGARPSDQTAR